MGFYLESIGVHYEKEPVEEFTWQDEIHQIIMENQMEVLNEAYYGKTKEVLAIEKKIGECRTKYKKDQMKFNTSKDRDELEKMFENVFGFTVCSFNIVPSNLHNASCIPVSQEIFDFKDFRKYIISDGKSIKYKKDTKAYTLIQVTKGLFYSSYYEDAEVFAIILHEIGHNFQTAMSNSCRNLNLIQKSVDVLASPILMAKDPERSPLKERWYDFCRSMRKNSPKLVDTFYSIKNFFNFGFLKGEKVYDFAAARAAVAAIPPMKGFEDIQDLFIFQPWHFDAPSCSLPSSGGGGGGGGGHGGPNALFFLVIGYIGVSFIRATGGVVSESFADQFASAHGYSTELSSALRKMRDKCNGHSIVEALRSMPIMQGLVDFITIPEKILSNFFNPHPNTISRINSQIKYLEYEVKNNKDLSSKMKRELQAQIAATQREMEAFYDLDDPRYIFSNRIDKIAMMCFGGDWRNFLTKKTPEEFEAAQERAEEQLRALKKK